MDVDEWKDLWSYKSLESVQLATVQALESNGIAIPRGEPGEVKAVKKGCVFGVPLEDTHQPLLDYNYGDYTFQLPRLFVELVVFLEQCPHHEGVFRKSGSVSRQKAFKSSFDSGDLSLSPTTSVHDVASLLKQYLRELPDPLLTQHFSPVFEACHALLRNEDKKRCILLTCLLLPWKHCQMLCVLMKLLHLISEGADQSLMTASNLSVVMAPNLMKPSNTIMIPSCNPLQTQTEVIKLLIENWNLIGRVPPDVGVASETLAANLQTHSSLDDIIKGAEPTNSLPQRYRGRKTRKKQRTASISGLVSGLGSRLIQKGVALTSGDYHMTSRGLRRKTSVKRKTRSQEDLLLPNKRPALQQADGKATPVTHPPIIHHEHTIDDDAIKSSEPIRTFKPSLTAKLDFVKRERRIAKAGQTSLTERHDLQTESTNITSDTLPVSVQRLMPTSFSFATPHHLPSPTRDPTSATPPHFIDPESEHIQVASFPITPYEHKQSSKASLAPYSFSKPAIFTSKCKQDLVSCDHKTTPTLPPGNDLLDHTFLQTPFPTATDQQSPNLLDKISSEIAQRHYGGNVDKTTRFQNVHFKVNESYKKAVRKKEHHSTRVCRPASMVDISLLNRPSLAQDEGEHSWNNGSDLCDTNSGCHGDGASQESIVSDDVDVCVRGPLNLSDSGLSAESADLDKGMSKEKLFIDDKPLNTRPSSSTMTSQPVIMTHCDTMTSSGRRHYTYSATLGMSIDLLTHSLNRDTSTSHKSCRNTPTHITPADEKWYISQDEAVSGPSTASKPHRSCLIDSPYRHSPSALSASLGITHLKQTHSNMNSRVHTPCDLSHSNSPIPSPPPALLHIVESNMLANVNTETINKSQTDSKRHSLNNASSEEQDKQDKNEVENCSLEDAIVKDNATNCTQENLQRVDDVPHVIEVAPELMTDKLRSAKKKRSKDLLVSQAPSPRVPFGLRSPWLRPKKERQITSNGIRTTEDGRVTKRAQAYMVSGHAHQQRWKHAPLKRVTRGTTDVSNKENCYHGNTGISKRNTTTREWIV